MPLIFREKPGKRRHLQIVNNSLTNQSVAYSNFMKKARTSQGRIQNPVKNLRWNVLRKQLRAFSG